MHRSYRKIDGTQDHLSESENSKTLYLAKDAARLLGISERQIHNLTARRELACVRIGRSVRFTREAIDAFVASRTIAAKGGAE